MCIIHLLKEDMNPQSTTYESREINYFKNIKYFLKYSMDAVIKRFFKVETLLFIFT